MQKLRFFCLHREEFQNLPDFFSFLGKVVGLDYLKNRAVPMENLDPPKQPGLKFHFEPSFGSKCFCAVGSFCWLFKLGLLGGLAGKTISLAQLLSGLYLHSRSKDVQIGWAQAAATKKGRQKIRAKIGQKTVKFGRNSGEISGEIRAKIGRNSGEIRAKFGQKPEKTRFYPIFARISPEFHPNFARILPEFRPNFTRFFRLILGTRFRASRVSHTFRLCKGTPEKRAELCNFEQTKNQK